MSDSNHSAAQLATTRLTHVALPVGDLDRSVDFYTRVAPLVEVHRHVVPDNGETAWLSNDAQVVDPFVIVLTMSYAQRGAARPVLQPFAHLGFEVSTRAEVDRIAELGAALDCLHWAAVDMPNPILGYLCALLDPDGNVVEFSCNQRVFATVRERWGHLLPVTAR
jgi:catechol 2,3-dioxygenase-like lactoylglutathione lyase family enzyme